MLRRSLLHAILVGALLGAPTSASAGDCPDRPACKGCGCKGGPGYRGPDGRCVGFKALARVCGSPPETKCVFENAPGTGLNKECALAPKAPKEPTAAPE